MKQLNVLVAFLALAVPVVAQSGDLSGRVAFIRLITAQETKPGLPGKIAPKVLVRFTREGESSTFLVLTDKTGTAFFPIEEGRYCALAFGLNGRIARLSTHSTQELHRCIAVRPGKAIEFSLTLAADATYEGSVPSLGVD